MAGTSVKGCVFWFRKRNTCLPDGVRLCLRGKGKTSDRLPFVSGTILTHQWQILKINHHFSPCFQKPIHRGWLQCCPPILPLPSRDASHILIWTRHLVIKCGTVFVVLCHYRSPLRGGRWTAAPTCLTPGDSVFCCWQVFHVWSLGGIHTLSLLPIVFNIFYNKGLIK